MKFIFGLKKTTYVLALSLSVGLVLGGCATDGRKTGSVSLSKGKPTAQMTASELNQATQKYGVLYQKNPKSKEIGLDYAAALRMTGRVEQSLAVMQQMVIHHSKDRQVLAAYGKALASTGNLEKALKIVRKAQRSDQPDWRLFSAEGAILDQMGKPKYARNTYRRALDLNPNEPTVLSNLGMSYVLTNDLGGAETYLRKAIVQPSADSLVRQNLALVVGLQGRFKEAETIARGELPSREAEANSKYLREMLAQQNAWKQLEKEDKKKKS
ncbi:MAG: tetratricopeptide repeat protein [Hyphomicrobiales bacterium]|nr:tetratricopeptide repeat protein [Hyphomicrobiales bacterium]